MPLLQRSSGRSFFAPESTFDTVSQSNPDGVLTPSSESVFTQSFKRVSLGKTLRHARLFFSTGEARHRTCIGSFARLGAFSSGRNRVIFPHWVPNLGELIVTLYSLSLPFP